MLARAKHRNRYSFADPMFQVESKENPTQQQKMQYLYDKIVNLQWYLGLAFFWIIATWVVFYLILDIIINR